MTNMINNIFLLGKIQYIIFRFTRLGASVQSSVMMNLGTSMYENSVEQWRLVLIKALEHSGEKI